jgi:hypothetical protein
MIALQCVGAVVFLLAISFIIAAAWNAWKQRNHPDRWGH